MDRRLRSYSELIEIEDYIERYDYLALKGAVGESTFGFERYVNQRFYRSYEWKQVRHVVIARDNGCDLAMAGYEIYDRIHIHHMNPMRIKDLRGHDEAVLDPEFLISVSHRTHNAIHYGDESLLPRALVERTPGDTRLW